MRYNLASRASPLNGSGVRRTSLHRIFIVALVVFAASKALACSCARGTPLDREIRNTPAIFEGTLVGKRIVFGESYGWTFPAVEYEFAVGRAWKGVSKPRVRLLSGYSNCASYFEGNGQYLVFASQHWERPGVLSSSICSRTQEARDATEEVQALGRPSLAYATVPSPIKRLSTATVVRGYVVAGMSSYINFVRRWDEDFGRLGLVPLAAAGLGILTFVASITVLKRSRKAFVVLLIACIALFAAGLFAAGRTMLSNPYFASYIEW